MQLRQFQKEGVHFLTTDHPKLRGKHHKLLADEMGLGKTPQACVALREIGAQSALIVCPKKIKRTWMRRLVEWGTCRQDQVQIIENSFDFINMRKTPFVIVNRELLVIHGEENKLLRQIFKTYFDVLVYDECQSLKNMDAQITNVILGRNGHNVAPNASGAGSSPAQSCRTEQPSCSFSARRWLLSAFDRTPPGRRSANSSALVAKTITDVGILKDRRMSRSCASA